MYQWCPLFYLHSLRQHGFYLCVQGNFSGFINKQVNMLDRWMNKSPQVVQHSFSASSVSLRSPRSRVWGPTIHSIAGQGPLALVASFKRSWEDGWRVFQVLRRSNSRFSGCCLLCRKYGYLGWPLVATGHGFPLPASRSKLDMSFNQLSENWFMAS